MTYKLILSTIFISQLVWSQSPRTTIGQDSTALQSGMIYGKNHAFFLDPPKGWVLDNSAGVSQGSQAVFYPIGGSWQNSSVVMYANVMDKEEETYNTFEKAIAYDISQFKERDSSVKIRDSSAIVLGNNKQAIVKTFFYSNYDAVAYIDESKVVVILVLSARTEAQFKNSYFDFKELVKSYGFFTDKVIFNNH